MRFALALLVLVLCSALGCGEKYSSRDAARSEPQVGRTLLGTEEQRQLVTDFVLSLDSDQLRSANGEATRLK